MNECSTCKVPVRGFEIVADWAKQKSDVAPFIPKRKTNHSAGYDLAVLEGATIKPGETVHFMTNIKVYMMKDELFIINVRSSTGFKKKLRLVNTQGWIDSDFYCNPDNDGNIGIGLYNPNPYPVTVEDGERVAQGVFVKYLVKDNDADDEKEERKGGIGSTGRK